jgi:5-hydroxyisourate hydrolase-like protein (transthyretin family)
LRSCQEKPAAATTDVSGAYRISGLKPGDYLLLFEADDYVSWSGNILRVDDGPVRLNAKLIPAAKIRGRVLDDEGKPAGAVPVELYRFHGGRSQTGNTDRDGVFVPFRSGILGFPIVFRRNV